MVLIYNVPIFHHFIYLLYVCFGYIPELAKHEKKFKPLQNLYNL